MSSNSEKKNSNTETETILILEKSLEILGQDFSENLNIIEHFLIEIIERLNDSYSIFNSNFILRRLPAYTGTFSNLNEYGIVLNKFPFLLNNPLLDSTGSTRRQNLKLHSNVDHIEIFANKSEQDFTEDLNEYTNANSCYLSQEIFKKFAECIDKISKEILEEILQENTKESPVKAKEKVQLIGPHLLEALKTNKEVEKIFTLIQPQVPINRKRIGKCQIRLISEKCLIKIRLEDTEVVVKPCLFSEKGYQKVVTNILERIPLFHSAYLRITESLAKGFLLFPSTYENYWNIQFWPSESHLSSEFHPNSITGRVFKLFTAFCFNPINFLETLNSSFLVGMPVSLIMDTSFNENQTCFNAFSVDFLTSSLLFEFENYSKIDDWSPERFYTRFYNLLNVTIDSYEKGFHSHYFTKVNILRGLWRLENDRGRRGGSLGLIDMANFEVDEEKDSNKFGGLNDNLDDLDSIQEFQEIDENSGAFGRKVLGGENISIENRIFFGESFDSDNDENDFEIELMRVREKELTSEMVYNVNPFDTFNEKDENPRTTSRNKGGEGKKVSSLSKMLGSKIVKKFSQKITRRSSSEFENNSFPSLTTKYNSEDLTGIMTGFGKEIAQETREKTLQNMPPPSSGSSNFHEGEMEQRNVKKSLKSKQRSFYNENYQSSDNEEQENNFSKKYSEQSGFDNTNETIYTNIINLLSEIPGKNFELFTDTADLYIDLDRSLKILEAQSELINCWKKIIQSENLKPKIICPHTFSQRQIQYICQVVQNVAICSPIKSNLVHPPKIPSWELSGDVLRLVLHQMRSDISFKEMSLKEKHINKQMNRQRGGIGEKTLSSQSFYEGSNSSGVSTRKNEKVSRGSSLVKKLSFQFKRSEAEYCKSHEMDENSERDNYSMEALEPEVCTTKRLLQWLWQLKNSEIGRLSLKARKYLEELYLTSFINSHFIEEYSEQKNFQTLALKSAVAVSRIMTDSSFPAHIPLIAAAKKGWLWAEMILSLASWNKEKGYKIKAEIRTNLDSVGEENKTRENYFKEIDIDSLDCSSMSILKKSSSSTDIDCEALTLAFHSQSSLPLGWFDFEDPRRPGPFTVPILIFSSINYYNKWEMINGNIIQVLLRLQKFNSLQHVGSLLTSPHRKTALNEIRKLNKSLSFRILQFDENVMSKTFKRIASLRSTRRNLTDPGNSSHNHRKIRDKFSCEELGCVFKENLDSSVSFAFGKEIQCTKL